MSRNALRSACILILCWLALGLVALPPAGADPAAPTGFVSPIGTGSVCSQAAPCALQTALTQAANGATIYVAQGAYTGTGGAVVALTKSIALYGGWDGAATGDVLRDPAAYPTTLDGERARRVVRISGDITPTLDGFIVTGGNASGVTDCYMANADGCGGGIFISNAHPVIANNVVTNNVAATTTSGLATATGYGGGLFLATAERAVIANNIIISNAGSTANWGSGGGIWVWGNGAGLKVQFNQIISNAATTTEHYGAGAGIYGGPDGAVIRGNVIAGNRNNALGAGGRGAGVMQYGGTAEYDGNLIRGNGGGAAVWLSYSRALFTRNRIVDNATGSGITLESGSGQGSVLANNLIANSGILGISAQGYSASNLLTTTLLHNTLVGSGSGQGISGSFANVYMTNTIVTGWALGVTNTTLVSATVSPDHTLFWANTNAGILGTNAANGNPAFVDPAGGDFHIGPASAATNQGAITWVTSDQDGEPRLGLPDIGADEYWAPGTLRRIFLPLVLRSD